jgi:hypothetical protein
MGSHDQFGHLKYKLLNQVFFQNISKEGPGVKLAI